jgi:hypothetical protein
MDKFLYRMVAGAASCLLPLGCASGLPPASRAAQVEQLQCDPTTSPQENARILQTTRVIASEAIYSNVPTAYNDIERRAIGAKLVIRPPEGVSAERMTRILQCHSSRELLGRTDRVELAGDPYWLPGAWVDIGVTPEDGNYAVTLQADTIARNLQLYSRAAAYADAHPVDTTPALP